MFVFVCVVGHKEFRDLDRFVAVNLLSLLKSYVSRMEDDISVNTKPYKVSKYQIDNIVIDSNLNCHSYSLHSLANCMPIALFTDFQLIVCKFLVNSLSWQRKNDEFS